MQNGNTNSYQANVIRINETKALKNGSISVRGTLKLVADGDSPAEFVNFTAYGTAAQKAQHLTPGSTIAPVLSGIPSQGKGNAEFVMQGFRPIRILAAKAST